MAYSDLGCSQIRAYLHAPIPMQTIHQWLVNRKKRKYILPYTFSQAYYHLTLKDPQLVEASGFGGGMGDREDWLVGYLSKFSLKIIFHNGKWQKAKKYEI